MALVVVWHSDLSYTLVLQDLQIQFASEGAKTPSKLTKRLKTHFGSDVANLAISKDFAVTTVSEYSNKQAAVVVGKRHAYINRPWELIPKKAPAVIVRYSERGDRCNSKAPCEVSLRCIRKIAGRKCVDNIELISSVQYVPKVIDIIKPGEIIGNVIHFPTASNFEFVRLKQIPILPFDHEIHYPVEEIRKIHQYDMPSNITLINIYMHKNNLKINKLRIIRPVSVPSVETYTHDNRSRRIIPATFYMLKYGDTYKHSIDNRAVCNSYSGDGGAIFFQLSRRVLEMDLTSIGHKMRFMLKSGKITHKALCSICDVGNDVLSSIIMCAITPYTNIRYEGHPYHPRLLGLVLAGEAK